MYFSNGGLYEEVRAKRGPVVLTCMWERTRNYGEYLDLKDRLGPDANFIDFICTVRIPPWLLLKSLQQGTQRIIIVACPDEQCRYGSNNRVHDSVSRIRDVLEMLGIEPNRLTLLQPRAQQPWALPDCTD